MAKTNTMNRLATLFLLLILSLRSFSQCTIDELFPIKLGQTKIEVLKTLQLHNDFVLGKGQENVIADTWKKFDYLEPDSVYRSQLVFNTTRNLCFNNYAAKLILEFSDNILFEITYELNFDKNDFSSANDIYETIISIMKPIFKDSWEDEYTSYKGDVAPNESTGMFYKFRNFEPEDRNMIYTEVSYNFDKKYVYSKRTYKLEDTGEIEKISLKIKDVNSTFVKIDGRGY